MPVAVCVPHVVAVYELAVDLRRDRLTGRQVVQRAHRDSRRVTDRGGEQFLVAVCDELGVRPPLVTVRIPARSVRGRGHGRVGAEELARPRDTSRRRPPRRRCWTPTSNPE